MGVLTERGKGPLPQRRLRDGSAYLETQGLGAMIPWALAFLVRVLTGARGFAVRDAGSWQRAFRTG